LDSISKQQRYQLSRTAYAIGKFSTTTKEKCPTESTVYFYNDGAIFNTTQKIGRRSPDKTLYFDYLKKKFFFNLITSPKNKERSVVHIVTHYTEENSAITHTTMIYLKGE